MDSIGDILYIVVIIIIGIISSISRKKKQDEAKRRREQMMHEEIEESPRPRPENPFESIFERFEEMVTEKEPEEFINEQEPEPIEEEKYQPLKYNIRDGEELEEIVSKDKNQIVDEILDGVPIDALESLEISEEKEKECELNIHSLFKNKDDVKKAIILSEIINRKY